VAAGVGTTGDCATVSRGAANSNRYPAQNNAGNTTAILFLTLPFILSRNR
jgi:hypothetical protein